MMDAAPDRPTRLTFDGVSRRFGARAAVIDLNLSVGAGEIVCLLGPSGCGKTTTLRLAAGLERPESGRILIDGACVAGPDRFVEPEDRGVGLMFQDFALFPHLTAAQNVAFGLTRLPSERRLAQVAAMLHLVDLGRRGASYPHELSGGEQQRVALARALAPEPRILLMDEPFSGLDPVLRDAVREETTALIRELGMTALIVTHDPDEAMRLGDRIALMRQGLLVQVGTPDTLYDRPVDRATAAFFGDVNIIHAFVAGHRAPTAFGSFPVSDIAEGTEVEVLVRPHAMRVLDDPAAGVPGRVLRSRRVGPEQILDIEVDPAAERPGLPRLPRLQARVGGHEGRQTGARVGMALDAEQVLIFPCENQLLRA